MLFQGLLSANVTLLYKNNTGNPVVVNLAAFYNQSPNVDIFVTLFYSPDNGVTKTPVGNWSTLLKGNTSYADAKEVLLMPNHSIYGNALVSDTIQCIICEKSTTIASYSPLCKQGVGSPIGVVLPEAMNQFYRDSAAQGLWQSIGLTNNDWIQWV